MKWRSLILGAVLHAAARAEDAPGTTLRWNNGESIKGRIAGASATELKWKSPLFDEPQIGRAHV